VEQVVICVELSGYCGVVIDEVSGIEVVSTRSIQPAGGRDFGSEGT
jgi:chemotaxis signal transduction protein